MITIEPEEISEYIIINGDAFRISRMTEDEIFEIPTHVRKRHLRESLLTISIDDTIRNFRISEEDQKRDGSARIALVRHQAKRKAVAK